MKCTQCGKCCRLFLINLSEEEWNSGRYKTMFDTDYDDAKWSDLNVLEQNPDGSCIYLKDGKCSIHDSRPKVCREFFCDSKEERFQDMIKKIKEYKICLEKGA